MLQQRGRQLLCHHRAAALLLCGGRRRPPSPQCPLPGMHCQQQQQQQAATLVAAASSAAAASTGAPAAPAAAAAGSVPVSRAYPSEPRVGVGVVVFRQPLVQPGQVPEVLLIRRAKEPAKGQWCFPGGSLELGESMAACAVREVLEETGVRLRHDSAAAAAAEGFSRTLQQPTPFAAVDSIMHDAQGRLQFHYVVVEVAAMAADPDAQPAAADDVDGAMWVAVPQLRSIHNLTKNCARLAEEAVGRFDLSG